MNKTPRLLATLKKWDSAYLLLTYFTNDFITTIHYSNPGILMDSNQTDFIYEIRKKAPQGGESRGGRYLSKRQQQWL
ncbi:hypothetical protein [Zhongshania sp.]|uniref:hypothetical protein n=1 Tax=Zhongshania sp. TaxID=1971902 RepID=UPI00356B2B2B